jgi:hypothetical protein
VVKELSWHCNRVPWTIASSEQSNLDFQDLANGALATLFAICYLNLLGGKGAFLVLQSSPLDNCLLGTVGLDFQDLVSGALATSFAIYYLNLLGGEGICLHCNGVPFRTVSVVKNSELPRKGWT